MLHTLFSSFLTSDLLGKCIFLGLFLLSVVSWWVIFEKIRWVYAERKVQLLFKKELLERHAQWIDWIPSATDTPPSLDATLYERLITQARILLKRNQRRSQRLALTMEDLEILDHGGNQHIEEMTHEMRDRLEVLSLAIPLSPFLGLLGTVWGMLGSFYHMRTSVGLSNDRVFEGLSMALATTVVGLLVAIPALISYYWINRQILNKRRELIRLKTQVVDLAQTHYRVQNFELQPVASEEN